MDAGIVLRLETCPQEHGASWLLLEGLGRIYVERVDGLVRVNLSRTDVAGEFRLGGDGGISALIDTGAQVCLIGSEAGASALRRSPYRGPTLRGADDTAVTCLSSCSFTIRFCGAAMQRAATATRSTNDRSAFTVIECVAQAAAEVVAEAEATKVNNAPVPPTSARPSESPGVTGSFTRWIKTLPGSTPISFAPNTKRGKSAARFSAYSSATTLDEYRHLNGAPHFAKADLVFDLDRGLAKLPTSVWAQRLGAAWVAGSGTAAGAAAQLEMVDLNAFALNVAQRLPVERFPDGLPPGFAVHLHEQATRLAEFDASLAANMRFGSATAARSMRDRSAFAVIESAGQAAAEVDAEEIGTVALAEVAASPALADVTDRSDDLDGICPAAETRIFPNGSIIYLAAGVSDVPAPPPPAWPPKNFGVAGSFTRWVKTTPGSTPISFAPNSKKGKSAACFSAYSSATTLEDYRRLNSAPHFTTVDLTFNLDRGLAQLPTGVWAQRLGAASAEGTEMDAGVPAQPVLVDLNAFVLTVAPHLPADHFSNSLPCRFADHLHEQALRLAELDDSLAAGVRFESLEDGMQSPTFIGGAVSRELLEYVSRISATVGLRKDMASVNAMLKDTDRSSRGEFLAARPHPGPVARSKSSEATTLTCRTFGPASIATTAIGILNLAATADACLQRALPETSAGHGGGDGSRGPARRKLRRNATSPSSEVN
jgi:hypothetical protein